MKNNTNKTKAYFGTTWIALLALASASACSGPKVTSPITDLIWDQGSWDQTTWSE